jgi:hypothetical protein
VDRSVVTVYQLPGRKLPAAGFVLLWISYQLVVAIYSNTTFSVLSCWWDALVSPVGVTTVFADLRFCI